MEIRSKRSGKMVDDEKNIYEIARSNISLKKNSIFRIKSLFIIIIIIINVIFNVGSNYNRL